MSHARSAVPVQRATKYVPARHHRRLATILVVLVALAIAVPAATVMAPPAPVRAGCAGWTSLTRPPDSIRVLGVQTGRIEVVAFRKYVATVMALEWPAYLPQAVVEAGAVATKQYAWYHVVYSRRTTAAGRCYDVKDSTGDQLYKPRLADIKPDHYRAIDATWSVTLRKYDRFFMTGYRRGEPVGCGRDATGWKLFAKSATRCASRGYGWRRILDTYYSPSLAFKAGDGGSDGYSSASSSLTSGSTTANTNRPSSGDANETTADANETTADANETTADANETTADAAAAPTGTETSGLTSERSQAITWRGSWRRARGATADTNTVSYLGSPGSNATFQFAGSSLELLGTRGPDRGWLEVFVDGTLLTTVDLFATDLQPGVSVLSQQWSNSAARTVLIRVVGTAGRPRVDLNAILVGP